MDEFSIFNTRVLGLDCSSNVIGWGLVVVDDRPMLAASGYIKLQKSDINLFVRLEDVENKIKELCRITLPTHISIEDILLHMKGKSSAKTITTLAIFNRTAGLSAYSYTKISPRLLPIGTIRKLIRKAYQGIDARFKKEDLPEIIRTHLSSNFVDTINRNNNVAKETYDEADGIATAWAYSLDLDE
ncbi:MAG: hypothetical protein ACXACY_10390 [Candidatus Hodarchaeales archaeon]|jgi:Holliday junction resolvasome RuvABC endonuclease subunit